MNQSKILKEIRILKAQNAAMTNALTVLEKEVAGSGVPATSKSKSKKAYLEEIAAQAVAKRRARIKKAAQGGS